MKLRTQLDNYDQASIDTGLDFLIIDPKTGEISREPSLAQQEFAEEVDINTIVRRFGLTGQLPENLAMPISGDFTNVTDYHTALNLIREADEQFLSLPGEMRARFEHDPARLMRFLEDPNNRAEAEKLGLVNKPPERTRTAVEAVDDLTKALTPPKA